MTPTLTESEPVPLPPGRRILDRLLVLGWLGLAAVFLAGAGWELRYHLKSPSWNSMWESAPLQVAVNVARGLPTYGDWHHGPVHLAIYGPLYYQTLGRLGRRAEADQADMIAIGRWVGIASLGAGLAGVVLFLRGGGAPWWASVLGTACVGLMTPTAMRFVASARPDAMAAALGVLGLAATLDRRRWLSIVGVLLLVAAWQVKVTALAPAMAAAVMLAWRRQWHRLALAGLLYVVANGAIVLALSAVTDGWYARHLAVASAAPAGMRYTWFMLTRRPAEPQIQYLFVFPAIALLSVGLAGWGRTTPQPAKNRSEQPGGLPSPVEPRSSPAGLLGAAGAFFVLSTGMALAAALRQGSDRNYLIEPTLAAGTVLGAWAAWASIPRGPRWWLLTRTAAVLALLSPLTLSLADRIERFGRTERAIANELIPYTDEAAEWVRSLPQPMLSLDSWLPYRAGVANDVNDPIAFGSFVEAGGTPDVLTERVARRAYASVVTTAPMDDAPYMLYGDIPSIWPELRQAIADHYVQTDQFPRDDATVWHVYTRKASESRSQLESSQ